MFDRHFKKEIEKEVLEEDEWLGNLQSLLRCPFGNQEDLSRYATQFIFVIQSESFLKEVADINLCVNTLKDLAGNRLFSDSIFLWLMEKINRQCRDVLAVSFLEEFQGDAWSDAFLQRFRSRYKDSEPKMLVKYLNVGRFSENHNNITRNITFIGEYYNE